MGQEAFREELKTRIVRSRPQNLLEAETLLFDAEAKHGESQCANRRRCEDAWSSPFFQELLSRRRRSRDPGERKQLSKEIRRFVRQQLRRRKSERFSTILTEFIDFDRIKEARALPIRHAHATVHREVCPDDFATFLENIFHSDSAFQFGTPTDFLNVQILPGLANIPQFEMYELRRCLKTMTGRT